MQVDPFTGLPIEGAPQANSLGAQAGINELTTMGYTGPVLDAMSNIPGVSTTMAWNVGRVQRTMLEGGRRPGSRARGFRQTFNPRNMGRLDDVMNVSPMSPYAEGTRGAGKGFYSPFNFLADMANKAANPIARRALGEVNAVRGMSPIFDGDKLVDAATWKRADSAGRVLNSLGIVDKGSKAAVEGGGRAEIFSKGTMGQLSSGLKAAKIRPGDPRLNQLAANARRLNPANAGFIDNLSYQRASVVGNTLKLEGGTLASAGDRASVGIAGIRGTASSRAAGYITEMAVGGISGNASVTAGAQAAKAAMATVGKEAGIAAGERVTTGAAMRVLGSKTVATEGARMAAAKIVGTRGVALGVKAAGPVGWAMMAYDLTKMGMSLMTGIANTAKDAAYSFKGSIDKPIMGMGYRDNTVAATSRARGVMAIQNSRLNARSALGSEGAAMAAHFG